MNIAHVYDPRVGVLMREGRDSGRTIYYVTLDGKHIERRSVRGIARVLARHDANSLARANVRGLAGQCPVGHDTKTPATKAWDCRVAAAAEHRGDDSTWVTSQQAVGGGVV